MLSQQGSQLRAQIGNLQSDVNAMNRKVKLLEKKGGRVDIVTCPEDGEEPRLCIRTDETDSDGPIVIGEYVP